MNGFSIERSNICRTSYITLAVTLAIALGRISFRNSLASTPRQSIDWLFRKARGCRQYDLCKRRRRQMFGGTEILTHWLSFVIGHTRKGGYLSCAYTTAK